MQAVWLQSPVTWEAGKQGTRTLARLPTPGLSSNPSVGLGISLPTPDSSFLFWMMGLHQPHPSQALLTKDRRLIRDRGQGPWNSGEA